MRRILLLIILPLVLISNTIYATSNSSVYKYERPNFVGGFFINGGLTSTLYWQTNNQKMSNASLSFSCWRLLGECSKSDEKITYYDDRILATQNINMYVGVKSKWVDLSVMSETYAIYHEGYPNGQSYVYQR